MLSDLQPYWNATCEQVNHHLWLPMAQDAHGQSLAEGCKVFSKTIDQSWFTQHLFQNNAASSFRA